MQLKTDLEECEVCEIKKSETHLTKIIKRKIHRAGNNKKVLPNLFCAKDCEYACSQD